MLSDSDLDIQGVDLGIDSLLDAAGLQPSRSESHEPFSLSSLNLDAELDLSGVDGLIGGDGGVDSVWDVPAPRAAVVQRGAPVPPPATSCTDAVVEVPEFDVSLPEMDEEAAFAETVAGFARIRSEPTARRREPLVGTQRQVLFRPPHQTGGGLAPADDDAAILGRARVATRLVRKESLVRVDAPDGEPVESSGNAGRGPRCAAPRPCCRPSGWRPADAVL